MRYRGGCLEIVFAGIGPGATTAYSGRHTVNFGGRMSPVIITVVGGRVTVDRAVAAAAMRDGVVCHVASDDFIGDMQYNGSRWICRISDIMELRITLALHSIEEAEHLFRSKKFRAVLRSLIWVPRDDRDVEKIYG
jgi:hypothetical protein